jgi:hypothetical protein
MTRTLTSRAGEGLSRRNAARDGERSWLRFLLPLLLAGSVLSSTHSWGRIGLASFAATVIVLLLAVTVNARKKDAPMSRCDP